MFRNSRARARQASGCRDPRQSHPEIDRAEKQEEPTAEVDPSEIPAEEPTVPKRQRSLLIGATQFVGIPDAEPYDWPIGVGIKYNRQDIL